MIRLLAVELLPNSSPPAKQYIGHIGTYFLCATLPLTVTCLLLAFLCGNRRSRIFIFALWSCDFEFPMEQCSSSAISRCAYPSTSCRSKICRHPPGSSSMARRNTIRSIAPQRFRSSFLTSRLRDGDALDKGSSSETTGGGL